MNENDDVIQIVRNAIEYAKRGDRPALEKVFEELFKKFNGYVYKIAYSILKNEDDALDATQETFYKVWRGLGGIKKPDKFCSWLGTIAENVAKDALKKILKEKNRPAPIPPDSNGDVPGNWLRDIIDEVLQDLPPRQRKVWELHEQGYTHSEIATKLGIPIGTVKSDIKRVRNKIKEKILKRYPEYSQS